MCDDGSRKILITVIKNKTKKKNILIIKCTESIKVMRKKEKKRKKSMIYEYF